jgi:hypothetical protein
VDFNISFPAKTEDTRNRVLKYDARFCFQADIFKSVSECFVQEVPSLTSVKRLAILGMCPSR